MNPNALTASDFVALRGKPSDAPELVAWMRQLDEQPSMEQSDADLYILFPKTGLELVFSEGRLAVTHIHGPDAEDSMEGYRGVLPHGLYFHQSRADVVKVLGTPQKEKAGVDDPRPFVHMYPRVKYGFTDHSIRTEFSMEGSRIRLVTLGKPIS